MLKLGTRFSLLLALLFAPILPWSIHPFEFDIHCGAAPAPAARNTPFMEYVHQPYRNVDVEAAGMLAGVLFLCVLERNLWL